MSFSFFPRTIYKTSSKISGEIVVKEHFGSYSLLVQEMTQSGGIVEKIWGKALERIPYHVSRITNCLVLGLGGGTVVKLIEQQYPDAKIVALEIDPEIIEIGKKYFGLGEVENLEIINADAIEWCLNDSNHLNRRFDLIIVDLYLGGEFPKKAMSGEFLKKLKNLLAKDGVLIFNWLRNKDEKELVQQLDRIFCQVEIFNQKTNLFLICRS